MQGKRAYSVLNCGTAICKKCEKQWQNIEVSWTSVVKLAGLSRAYLVQYWQALCLLVLAHQNCVILIHNGACHDQCHLNHGGHCPHHYYQNCPLHLSDPLNSQHCHLGWSLGPALTLVLHQLASNVADNASIITLQVPLTKKQKRHTHLQQYLKVQINLVWTWQEGEITTSLQYSTPCTRVPFIQLFLQLLGNSRVVVCLCKEAHCTLLVLAYEVLHCQRSSIIARTTCGSHYWS